MNWVDGVLIALLLASVIVGSKKGLVRELMAFVIFFAAIVFSVNYIDNFAVWVYDQVGGSPLISAFLSFAILLALSYVAFKLLGFLFYKVADIKNVKKRDQMGGAIIGFLRGWAAIGFITFLAFLLPMPERFYTDFENSFFGPTVAKTLPLMYEGTSAVHPNSPNFIQKIENTLINSPSSSSGEVMTDDRADVYRVMYQIDRFFNLESEES
ncbi:MAG: CvpA family protein [bacterium]|nr:CvpA family protein [bacterium]